MRTYIDYLARKKQVLYAQADDTEEESGDQKKHPHNTEESTEEKDHSRRTDEKSDEDR